MRDHRRVLIAAYNVENMFRRPAAFAGRKTKEPDTAAIEAYANLVRLLAQKSYSGKHEEIIDSLEGLTLKWSNRSGLAYLRQVKGKLLARHWKPEKSVEIVAEGRGSWVGWVELNRIEINERGTANIGEIVAEIDPDVLAVVEAEDRMTLERFNHYVLRKRFGHTMLIDGNDERGIDVGVMTKEGFPVGTMRSHVDDTKDGKQIFSRDCAEYEIPTPDGGSLLLLINHFKSKMGGGDAKRKAQAEQVAKIYKQRLKEGFDRIVVAGDLNDTPDSKPLAPLLAKTNLKDVGRHKDFDWGDRQGTYEHSKKQFDYLLLSPALFKVVNAGGVNRRGIWKKSHLGDETKMLPTITEEIHAASDHALIWVDLDV